MPNAAQLAAYLDARLRTTEVPDYDRALNGLQFGNRGEVTSVAAAVDFSSFTVQEAVRRGAKLLLVHHGMFWDGTRPIVGQSYDRLALLMAHDIAVYSSHLPLDAHPELGNNALLARRLGLDPTGGFARYDSFEIGVSGSSDVETRELVERASDFAAEHGGTVIATPHAPIRRTLRWGICTGAGANTETLNEAKTRGLDTLIVGEGPHHTAVQARDSGIVIIYAGHYATETLGVAAVAQELSREFGVAWSFIEAPTGL